MRASPTVLAPLLLLAAGCPRPMVVPTQDPHTQPAVTLDVNFPQGKLFTVSQTGFNPAMPTELQGTEQLDLAALCTDATSGCKSVELRVEGVATAADGAVTQVPASATLALTQDANNTGPGSKAVAELRALNTLQVGPLRQGAVALRLTVFARAINSFGATSETRKVTLFWTNTAPLAGSPCAAFHPIGSPGPALLDGREVFKAVEQAKNANPGQTSFVIAVYSPPSVQPTRAWRLDLTEVPGMPRTTATFKLVNHTNAPKSALVVNSRNCNAPVTPLDAGVNGASAAASVSTTDATTFVLSDGGQDVVLWDEPSFWAAFGGRNVAFTWKQ